MNDVLLEVRNLSVRYGEGSRALSEVALQLRRGEIVALLGPNGAGKSTMLRAISGLLTYHKGGIDSGSVWFDGNSIDGLDAPTRVRLGIAQVMEGRRIFSEMSVADNLAVGAYTRSRNGAGKKEIVLTLEMVLDFFPILRQRLQSVAGYLSGGEQQMLAIGRALMANPKLLLLDEPSLGIAPKVIEQIVEILTRINEQGVSIMLVEQNASVALNLCHHATILETGKVAAQGTAEILRSDSRVRRIYMGMDDTCDAVSDIPGRRRGFRADHTEAHSHEQKY